MITEPGSTATPPSPGTFAITPGTQMSVLLQTVGPGQLVITHIKTIVDDRRPANFSGAFTDLTPGCQGEPDQRFYVANFGQNESDVRPGSDGSPPPPLTVASNDSVVIYITMPALQGTVAWHLRITWAVNGNEKTEDIFNQTKTIIASDT